MAEKDFSDVPVAHDEKITTLHEPDLADATARRASIALNIIENPLRVSRRAFAFLRNQLLGELV